MNVLDEKSEGKRKAKVTWLNGGFKINEINRWRWKTFDRTEHNKGATVSHRTIESVEKEDPK